jgi:hypothetical protein
MALLDRADVPLPANVDDWIDEECLRRGVTFADLAAEALEAHPDSFGEDEADRLTVALCWLCGDRTDLDSLADPEWRRSKPLTPEQAAWLERAGPAKARVVETQKQMIDRAGPIYEISKARSKIVSDAWKAAGGPRRVYRVGWGADTSRFCVRSGKAEIEVGEAEYQRWQAWVSERERLRREIAAGDQGDSG